MKDNLRSVKKVYFNQLLCFDTGVIFEYDNLHHQVQQSDQLLQFFRQHFPEIHWQSMLAGKYEDKYIAEKSPPIINCVLRANVTDLIPLKTITIDIDGKQIVLTVESISLSIFPFNTGILELKLAVPVTCWRNTDILQRISWHINGAFMNGEFYDKFDWGVAFNDFIESIRHQFDEAVSALSLSLLSIPFVDIKPYLVNNRYINWRHTILIAIMPKDFDLESEHYQNVILDISGHGVTNLSGNRREYAYTENHNSIFIINDMGLRHVHIEDYIENKWIYWLQIHLFTWNMIWQLDKLLASVLNTTKDKLKKTEFNLSHNDVYQIDAFLNYIHMCVDRHHPKHIVKYVDKRINTMYDIERYLIQAQVKWNTDKLMSDDINKMEKLSVVIKEMYEFGNSERSRTVERFLALLGVFGLGTFLMSYINGVSFTNNFGDLTISLFVYTVLGLFGIVIYYLMRY